MRKRPPLGPVLLTAARCRCPRCRQGRLFRGWPNRVWRNCPVCGLVFLREAGYFIGGMILTYIFTVVVLLAVFGVSLLLPFRSGVSDNPFLWTALGIALALGFIRPAYSLWLAIDYWIAPWPPGQPAGVAPPASAPLPPGTRPGDGR